MQPIINTNGMRKRLVWIAALPLTVAAALAGAAEKSQPQSPLGLSGEVMSSGFMLQVLSALALVLVCVIGLAWMMRRFGRLQSSAHGALRMIDGMALSTRERIVLIEVGDTQLLLGVAPGRVDTLHVLGEPLPEVTATKNAGSGFSARLRDALGAQQ